MPLPELHLSDEQIALRALGEPLPSAEADHLHQCARCAAEVDQLSAVVATARSVTDDDAPRMPSPKVWDRITGELGVSPATQEVEGIDSPASRGVVSALPDRRHRWSTGLLVAACSLGIVAGGALVLAAGAVIGNDQSLPPPPTATVVATASLSALPDHAGSGAAEIVDTPRGQELVVDVSHLTKGPGFYEIWLIDPKTFDMVGLGALSGHNGRFVIPEGLDLSRYNVVDVSIEPFDGNPLHSKNSVVRGQLPA